MIRANKRRENIKKNKSGLCMSLIICEGKMDISGPVASSC